MEGRGSDSFLRSFDQGKRKNVCLNRITGWIYRLEESLDACFVRCSFFLMVEASTFSMHSFGEPA